MRHYRYLKLYVRSNAIIKKFKTIDEKLKNTRLNYRILNKL